MLEVLDSPESVLAVRAVGELQRDDYVKVLLPELERLVKANDEIRAVIVLGDEFTGMSATAVFSDIRVGLEHITKWQRCAVVSDKEWVKQAIHLMGWTMPGDVKLFDESQLQEALSWAAA